MFVTTAPCLGCSIKIKTAKIAGVYYQDEYKNSEGLDYLRIFNIPCTKIE